MRRPKQVQKLIPKIVMEDETWITRYWRPMMAWQYFVVCICDFIIFPSMSMYYAAKYGVSENFKWDPITLTAGGFYHIAMGVIVGISAYTRGQENLLRTRLFANAGPGFQNSPPEEECYDELEDGSEPPAHPTVRSHKGG